MKVCNLTKGLLVSLLLSVTAVEAEDKYPATDFQPKVVFQDSNYKHSGSSASASSSKSSREVSTSDSNYPAANFQPEVLYQDKNYKHTKGSVSNASASASEATASAESVESSEGGTSSNMLLGLMLIAVAGFLFYKKGNEAASAPAKRKATGRKVVANTDAGGASGVARYIESKAGPLVSGVSKYLEERESVAASSVAKYVARQKVSARKAEAENASSVEKYLRDRG